MSSRRIMCIWQALNAADPSAKGNPAKDLVKSVTSTLTANGKKCFSMEDFESHFKESNVTYDEYVNFVQSAMKKPIQTTGDSSEDEIEDECWSISKKMYGLGNLSIQECCARMLWDMFNQLCVSGTLPATMDREDANWIAEKISSRLEQHWNVSCIQKSVTFAEFVRILDEKCFLKAPPSAVKKPLTDIHSWLVQEIAHSGWLYKCNEDHLPGMDRKWFVLVPGLLIYFDSKRMEKKNGEVPIGKNSKVENLPNFQFNVLAQNCRYRFMLTNSDNQNTEFAVVGKHEKVSWMDALDEVIQAAKVNESPLQLIMKERMSLRKSTDKDETNNNRNIEDGSQKTAKSMSDARYKPLQKKKDVIPQKMPMDMQDEKVKEKVKKIEVIFCQFDEDDNGAIDRKEFRSFIQSMGLKLEDKEVDAIFSKIEDSENGIVTMDEFTDYFMNSILDQSGKNNTKAESDLLAAFMKADRDGTGTIDFKEFTNYMSEKKRNMKSSEIMKIFSQLTKGNDDMSLDKFQNFIKKEGLENGNDQNEKLEGQLMNMYNDADAEYIAKFLHERWTSYASFERAGSSGDLVMTGGEGMVADVLPGEYSLVDLACYNDLPPIRPRYIEIKNVEWIKSPPKGHGKVIFPEDFDGFLPVDVATTEHLRYYGGSLADSTQVEVSLMNRHGIQDFTYENNYLEDYVESTAGGCGLEKHEFAHLDCPLQDDSGYFVVGKMVGEVLHMTAFKVPTRHTMYLPGGIIHSNDYMKGTWRTMLSDAAAIDHCHIMKRTNPNNNADLEGFNFTFGEYK